jgi:hypothetical protein
MLTSAYRAAAVVAPAAELILTVVWKVGEEKDMGSARGLEDQLNKVPEVLLFVVRLGVKSIPSRRNNERGGGMGTNEIGQF